MSELLRIKRELEDLRRIVEENRRTIAGLPMRGAGGGGGGGGGVWLPYSGE
jgi:hypothetical protein